MITLDRISKSYQNRAILSSIDMVFSDRRHYAIFGQSGSGKTTLLNLLAGYEQADSGSLEVDGESRIGYLFQDTLLFSNLSVRENMLITWMTQHRDGGEAGFDESGREALDLFSVGRLYDERACALSGGERRRVELAQIFLTNPDILLLDEPTSSLDAVNKRRITEVIRSSFEDAIIILVSHEDRSFFEGFTRLDLRDGRLING